MKWHWFPGFGKRIRPRRERKHARAERKPVDAFATQAFHVYGGDAVVTPLLGERTSESGGERVFKYVWVAPVAYLYGFEAYYIPGYDPSEWQVHLGYRLLQPYFYIPIELADEARRCKWKASWRVYRRGALEREVSCSGDLWNGGACASDLFTLLPGTYRFDYAAEVGGDVCASFRARYAWLVTLRNL